MKECERNREEKRKSLLRKQNKNYIESYNCEGEQTEMTKELTVGVVNVIVSVCK